MYIIKYCLCFVVIVKVRLDLNIQDCIEKSLKIKLALKSTWKTLKGLEKSWKFIIYRKI